MKVDVCGIDFEIKEVDSNSRIDSYMGRCDTKMGTITINKDMPGKIKQTTLVHEWLHAVLDCGGYAEESGNEKLISFLQGELYRAGFRPIIKEV